MNFRLHPRLAADSWVVGDFDLSRVLLINDANYPWLVLVPRRCDIREIYQLPIADQLTLLNESSALSERLMAEFTGDKLNVAALGNMVPQLHIHHIVRYTTDAAWPAPVWGALPATAYAEQQAGQLVTRLQGLLAPIAGFIPA